MPEYCATIRFEFRGLARKSKAFTTGGTEEHRGNRIHKGQTLSRTPQFSLSFLAKWPTEFAGTKRITLFERGIL